MAKSEPTTHVSRADAHRVEEKPKSQRDLIVEAAIELVLQDGAAGFETKVVALKAGVNQPQINYYFGSRDGLLTYVAGLIYDQYVDSLSTKVKAAKTPRDAIVDVIEEAIDFNKKHPGVGTLAFYPHLFAVSMDEWQATASNLLVLDLTEQLDLVLLSCMYAVHFRTPYRLIDRSRVNHFHRAYPRVTNAAATVMLSLAGYVEEWSLRSDRPVYGLDLASLLRSLVLQIVDDLVATPPEGEVDETLFL